MHQYLFHIGDYLKATAHLTPMEDLAYRRLLDMYYDTESNIPLETHSVSRRLRLDSQVVESVLSEFFERTENGWVHGRCEAEIAEYNRICQRNRENGKAGGRPKKTQSVSSGKPKQTQSNPTGNQTQNPKPKTNTLFGFDEFWAAYPKKKSRDAAAKAWAKITPDEQLQVRIIAAVKRATTQDDWTKDGGQFIPHAATWLNGKRWEDELSPGTTEKPSFMAGAI